MFVHNCGSFRERFFKILYISVMYVNVINKNICISLTLAISYHLLNAHKKNFEQHLKELRKPKMY